MKVKQWKNGRKGGVSILRHRSQVVILFLVLIFFLAFGSSPASLLAGAVRVLHHFEELIHVCRVLLAQLWPNGCLLEFVEGPPPNSLLRLISHQRIQPQSFLPQHCLRQQRLELQVQRKQELFAGEQALSCIKPTVPLYLKVEQLSSLLLCISKGISPSVTFTCSVSKASERMSEHVGLSWRWLSLKLTKMWASLCAHLRTGVVLRCSQSCILISCRMRLQSQSRSLMTLAILWPSCEEESQSWWKHFSGSDISSSSPLTPAGHSCAAMPPTKRTTIIKIIVYNELIILTPIIRVVQGMKREVAVLLLQQVDTHQWRSSETYRQSVKSNCQRDIGFYPTTPVYTLILLTYSQKGGRSNFQSFSLTAKRGKPLFFSLKLVRNCCTLGLPQALSNAVIPQLFLRDRSEPLRSNEWMASWFWWATAIMRGVLPHLSFLLTSAPRMANISISGKWLVMAATCSALYPCFLSTCESMGKPFSSTATTSSRSLVAIALSMRQLQECGNIMAYLLCQAIWQQQYEGWLSMNGLGAYLGNLGSHSQRSKGSHWAGLKTVSGGSTSSPSAQFLSIQNNNAESILVMLVVLEGPQELVVLGEGLVAAGLRHVVGAVLQLLPPKGDRFLPLVARVGVDELLQLIVAGDLVALLVAQRLPEVVVHIFVRHCHSVLVVHYQLADLILVQWLLLEGGLACCLVKSFPALLFLPQLLIFQRQLHLLEILHGWISTSCSSSWCFLPVLAKLSALFSPLPQLRGWRDTDSFLFWEGDGWCLRGSYTWCRPRRGGKGCCQ